MGNPGVTSKDSECKKKAKAARCRFLQDAANKGGEALYSALATVYNTFVDLLKTMVQVVVAFIEPIITIDKFVFDTFVKPPLSAVKSLASTLQRTVVIPAQIIGATGNACKAESQNAVAVKKVEQHMTRDLNWLVNKLDKMEYSGLISQDQLDALRAFPDKVDGLKAPTWNDFINFGCN